jgi:hypothetical protein
MRASSFATAAGPLRYFLWTARFTKRADEVSSLMSAAHRKATAA